MTVEHDAVWGTVLERFRDGYGGEPDFDDKTDRYLIITLMEEAVHKRITRGLVASIQAATARIEAETRALEGDRRHRERQP